MYTLEPTKHTPKRLRFLLIIGCLSLSHSSVRTHHLNCNQIHSIYIYKHQSIHTHTLRHTSHTHTTLVHTHSKPGLASQLCKLFLPSTCVYWQGSLMFALQGGNKQKGRPQGMELLFGGGGEVVVMG